MPLNLHERATHHKYDPESYLENLFLGQPLDGLKAMNG
jgi:hypothetical protein